MDSKCPLEKSSTDSSINIYYCFGSTDIIGKCIIF